MHRHTNRYTETDRQTHTYAHTHTHTNTHTHTMCTDKHTSTQSDNAVSISYLFPVPFINDKLPVHLLLLQSLANLSLKRHCVLQANLTRVQKRSFNDGLRLVTYSEALHPFGQMDICPTKNLLLKKKKKRKKEKKTE